MPRLTSPSPRVFVAFAWLLLAPVFALAQQARDRAVELTATPATSPNRIILNWDPAPQPSSGIWVYRRAIGGSTWTQIAYPGVTATTYSDTTAATGTRYEYRVYRTTTDNLVASAYGYALAGIDAPLLDQRGTVVLVIDSTQQTALASEIARFQRDLVGDGWIVVTETAAPTDTPASVRAKLQTRYNAAPSSVTAAILLGRVPVPYSGDLRPDGHTDHQGAWPADTYYADLTGTWTDTTVNRSTASQARNHNIPGDGKFDQSHLPTDAEIAVGRIDMANLSGFSAGANATELLRNYLRKNHEFRHRLGAFADIPRRALIDDHFGYNVGTAPNTQPEAPAAVAWRNFTPLFGSANITAADWFTTLQTQSYLWAYGAGPGGFSSASGIGTSADFKTRASRAVFNGIFGSYFGDWDSPTDPLLRSVLAGSTDSLSLVSLWANRPEWVLHGMALGETVGDAYLRTVNNPGSYGDNFNTGYFNHYTDNPRGVHTALLGDPTLRLHPVAAPASAAAPTRTAGASADSVALAWSASTETGLVGYHVYRSASALGPFTRLTANTVSNTHYTDSAAPKTDLHYLVRAVVLTSSASGTYHNAGQALFLSVAVNPPAAPASFTASPASATSIDLAWTPDPFADLHRLERSLTGANGTWTLVADDIPGDAVSYTDTGLAAETTYFYRIRSTNPAGDGAWSTTASATTFPEAALALILPTTAITETSGSFTATVARAGTTGNQAVVLSSNDPRLSVPATVTILAGQTSASFTVTVTDDTVLNPSNLATLSAFFPDALVGESFTGPANTAIGDQNTGWGWSGPWYSNNIPAVLVEPSLTYTKNGTIGGPGTRALRLNGSGGSDARRNFATKYTSGDVWVSTLLHRNSGNWATQMIIRENTDGGITASVNYENNTNHWRLLTSTGSNAPLLASNPSAQVHHLVMRFDFEARQIHAWFNPDASGSAPANALGSAIVPMPANLTGISRLDFFGYSTLDGFDEPRIATSFAALRSGTTVTNTVTLIDDENVPEPGPGVIEFTAPVFETIEPVYTGTTASQTKTVTITARRTGGNEGAVSVDYVATIIESLSFAGENYNIGVTGSVSREFNSGRPHVNDGHGTLTWANGESGVKSFSFTINADSTYTSATNSSSANNVVEGIETLELLLARPRGGAILGELSRARLDILDAQAPAGGQGVIQFERPRFSAFENAGSMPVVLRRVQGSTGTVSAVVTTSSSLPTGYGGFANPITPAVAGADYTTVSQTVTWADGDTADKTVHVPLIDNAAVQAASQSRGVRGIRFQLSAPAGGALVSVNEALGLILDDESETYDVWIENLYGKRMSIRLPRYTPVVRGLIHFLPGTGGDWRPQVNSASHQAVADQWGFAISGQDANAFATTGPAGIAQFHNHLDALALFTGRPELRNAPVVFTGMSAGGYASTASHGAVPDQVLGFVAHKGGGYDFKGVSDLDTKPPIHESNLFTPGLLIAGGNDGTVPAQDLYNAFLSYRQNLAPGSQVTTAIDWNIGHSDTGGQGWAMAYLFIDELIRLRYPSGQLPGQVFGETVNLTRIPHADTWLVQQVNGFLGTKRPDPALAPRNLQIRPAAGVSDPGTDGIMLSERLARAYQAFSSLHATSYQSAVPFQSPLRISSHTTTHTQITGIDLGQSTPLTLDPRNYTNFNRADFYFNNQLVGTRTSAPWSITFTPAQSGVGLLRVETSTNGSGETRYAFETLLVRDIPPYPPAAPTGLAASRPTATTASLTWATVPFATGIVVQRAAAGAAGPWTPVASLAGTATTFTDTGLSADASYWYRLVATNAYGDSPATAAAVLLVENLELLVSDPFTDGGVTNGADPLDVVWTRTDGSPSNTTFSVVEDSTLDSVAPHHVAELHIDAVNTERYLSFPLPSAVNLAADQGLRVSFKLRHTGTPRADASATGVSLASSASSAPWNNANNREYFFVTSYGSTTPQGTIRKTGTGGAQLLNSGTQTLATGLASINAGTNVTTVSLEVFRTGESTMRIRYRLGGGPAQEFVDTSDIVTSFNRVFLRFRTLNNASTPAFRLDDVTVHRITPALAPPPAPVELWQASYFTADELSNPALEATLWGHLADPDRDGLPNLLEYALGQDPLSASATHAPAAALSPAGTALALTFFRARADVAYEILASSDLVTWTVIATNPGQVGQEVTVTDGVFINPRRFLRLRVSLP